MLLQKERELIVEYGKKLFNQGLTKATGGNLSICNRQENLILITPSAKDYLKIKPEDITVLNFKNEIIDGMLIPSSELDMHMIFYKRRKDINAVVHTHSVFATTFSCLKWDIPPIHYLIGFAGEKVE
jgi:L-fuculose-phosphate aldolase